MLGSWVFNHVQGEVAMEDDLKSLIIKLAEGLGFEIRDEQIVDARKLKRLPDPLTPQEMRQRTTLAVTRYTLTQLRAECPPVMTMDAFLQQLLFLYRIVKNKGVFLDFEK